MQPSDQQASQHTPVIEDAHATVQQLLARAAHDYAHGWGQPDARATDGKSLGSAA